MRYWILLTLTACSALGAAEMWRWVDSDGVVHYSDRASPGAEKFSVQSAAKPGSTPAQAAAPPARTAARPTEFRYTSCAITRPANDEVFTNLTTVSASLEVLPGQRPGDRVVMNLNGRRVENWPESGLGYVLTDLYRGSYSLSAQVLDETGKTMCSSPSIAFHIRQPSMLTPAGKVPTAPRVPGAPSVPKPAARP